MLGFGRMSFALLAAGRGIEVAAFGFLADGESHGRHMSHRQLHQHLKREWHEKDRPDLQHLLKRSEEDERVAQNYKRQLSGMLGNVLGGISGKLLTRETPS